MFKVELDLVSTRNSTLDTFYMRILLRRKVYTKDFVDLYFKVIKVGL